MIEKGAIAQAMANFVAVCFTAPLNNVVAGNTSSGKTTYLNHLARNIPYDDRIVTIEDSVDLQMIMNK